MTIFESNLTTFKLSIIYRGSSRGSNVNCFKPEPEPQEAKSSLPKSVKRFSIAAKLQGPPGMFSSPMIYVIYAPSVTL